MITTTAIQVAAENERIKKEREDETRFAQNNHICPRCAGPLKPGWLCAVLKCKACNLSWEDWDLGGGGM